MMQERQNMLKSHAQYVEALRQGNYLRFLEWPRFIAGACRSNKDNLDADAILNTVIFEWLRNGFCQKDWEKFAILSALVERESTILQGNLNYAFISITGALYQCMFFHSNRTHESICAKETINIEEIHLLLKENHESYTNTEFESALKIQTDLYADCVRKIPVEELEKLFTQIIQMIKKRYEANEYLSCIEEVITRQKSTPTNGEAVPADPLQDTRFIIVNKLVVYLNGEMEFNEGVQGEIKIYVGRLRGMQPAPYEQEFINRLVAPTLVEKTIGAVKAAGSSFFRFVISPAPARGKAVDVNADESASKIAMG